MQHSAFRNYSSCCPPITLVNNKFSSENSLSELDTVFHADSKYVLSFFSSRQVSKMRAVKISGKIRKNFAQGRFIPCGYDALQAFSASYFSRWKFFKRLFSSFV